MLIQDIKQLSSVTKIIVSAVAHRLHKNSAILNEKTDKLNRALRSMCYKDGQCSFIDVNPSVKYENYRRDGLHFNPTGSRLFANYLTRCVEQIVGLNFPVTQHQRIS
jgi:lysophospholipase L1-like esterase